MMESLIEKKELVAGYNCKRLDIFLTENIEKSRSFCSKLIEKGFVSVNGTVVLKAGSKINENDTIAVMIPEEKKPDLTPKNIDFEIIYENSDYVIINKPAGIVVHPAPGNFENTLVNGLLYKFSIETDNKDFRPGIVHRLDKDTSGLMIVTKHRSAKEKFSEMFKDREIIKKYKCLSIGNPEQKSFIIEQNIGRHPKDRKKMAVVEKGRYAKTSVLVLKRFKNEFISEVEIFTGRTHQIRVHMSYLQYPIIGDRMYGNKKSVNYPIDRQALHAYFLRFNCPFTHKELEFSIDYPDDMKKLISFLETDSLV